MVYSSRLVLRFVSFLALLSSTLWLSSCGSGGGGAGLSACDIDTFTPNYGRNVDHLLNWSSFPVTVFFVKDANYTTARQNLATDGFDQWVSATQGVLTYSLTNDVNNADITVRFDPTTSDGVTTIHFSGFTLSSADMALGTRNNAAADIQCIAAHEFGHALGIDGHSDDQNDLMYAIHFVGTVCPVTQRDLNTIKTGYCHLFGRAESRCAPVPAATGPQQTKQIK